MITKDRNFSNLNSIFRRLIAPINLICIIVFLFQSVTYSAPIVPGVCGEGYSDPACNEMIPIPIDSNNSPSCTANSSINIDSLSLQEEIPIVGVPFELSYSSGRFRAGVNYRPISIGLGGWTPSIVHFYDFNKNILYFGNGGIRNTQVLTAGTSFFATNIEGSEIYYFNMYGFHEKTRDAHQNQTQIIAELDSSGKIAKQFVYGEKSNIPDYMIYQGKEFRIISDQVGTPKIIVDSTRGEIIEKLRFDEFGVPLEEQELDEPHLPFGFAGGIYDRDTKLVRMGARDYDPIIGRWIGKDPIGFGGEDTNLFGYVSNDPINFIDPEGTFLVPVIVGVAIFLNPSVIDIAGAAFKEIYEGAAIVATGVVAQISPVLINSNRYIRIGEGKFPEPYSKRISIGNTPGKKFEIGITPKGRLDLKIGNNRINLRQGAQNKCPKE